MHDTNLLPEIIEISGIIYQKIGVNQYENIEDYLNMDCAEGQGLLTDQN